jgi:exoribonuclease-2
MDAAVCSPLPVRHEGTGLAAYARVSSPIRRYGDFLAHCQLRAFLCPALPSSSSSFSSSSSSVRYPVDRERMPDMAGYLTRREKEVKILQRQSEQLWGLHFLHRQPPEREYSAVVFAAQLQRTGEAAALLLLPEVGFLRVHSAAPSLLPVGSVQRVRVASVLPHFLHVQLQFLDPPPEAEQKELLDRLALQNTLLWERA